MHKKEFIEKSSEVLLQHKEEGRSTKDNKQERPSSLSIEDWKGACLEKEADLKLVAEIGQTLLEKSRRDEEEIQKLKERCQSKDAEIEELRSNIKDIKFDRIKLSEQIRNAEAFNTSIMKELTEKQKAQQLKLVEHRVNLFLVEQNRHLLEQVEVYKAELEKKALEEDNLKRVIAKLGRQLKNLEESKQIAKDTDTKSEGQQKMQVIALNDELLSKKQELEEISQKMVEKSQQVDELDIEKKTLEVKLNSVMKTNEEMQDNLELKSAEIEKLKELIEELQVRPARGGSIHDRNPKLSVMAELEQMQRDRERKSLSRTTSSIGFRISPAQEEYFHLSCSAIKLNLAMTTKSAEHVFLVKEDELFQQAFNQKPPIPFHMWHSWLESQFILKIKEAEDAEKARIEESKKTKDEENKKKEAPRVLEKKKSSGFSFFGGRSRRSTISA